jgi:hypothetical protein
MLNSARMRQDTVSNTWLHTKSSREIWSHCRWLMLRDALS